jgi:hypothetical protein
MKKVVIFVHGILYPDFTENDYLHKNYKKNCKTKIIWKLVSGHLNKDNESFPELLKELKIANIFLCDSDNTNLEDKIENLNLGNIFHQRLIDALKQIKKRNPHLQIFIKSFSYTLKKEIEALAKYGKIIETWLNEEVIDELEK